MVFPKSIHRKEFPILIVAMMLSIIAILIWFALHTYNIERQKLQNIFLEDSRRIERTFIDIISHTESVMKMMIMQIRPDSDNAEYINGILGKYRPNPNVTDALTWTIFSWVNAKKLITVDSVYGILPQPIDLSNRDYIPLTERTPNKIQLGQPVFGSTSKRWMIPAGLGGTGLNNEYLGTITVGFDIENLTSKLQHSVKADGIDFALIDENIRVVLRSSDRITEFSDGAVKDLKFRELFSRLLQQNNATPYSEIHLTQYNGSTFYAHKLAAYPYVLFLKYDNAHLQYNIWNALTSRFIEVLILAGVAVILLILLYKHEMRLRQKLQQANDLLEEKVHQRTAELERALKIKTEFLNNLSHEIRIPMHGVVGFSDVLVENWLEWEDDQRLHAAVKIQESANRLIDFLSVILDISKIEAGKMTFDMQLHDVALITQQVIEECAPLTVKNNLSVSYDNVTDNSSVICDEVRIRQVIRNLLSNSLKFTSNGSITIVTSRDTLTYDDGSTMEALRFSISDEGIGIHSEELDEIFTPFSQGSRTSKGAGGTGLGLSISHEIIHAHYGKIWAENNAAKGAKFVFLIPYMPPFVEKDSYVGSE